jgi:outer membrane protein assembly factor BamA
VSRNLSFIPIPQVGFSPETGLLYGVAFDYFFNASGSNKKDSARESYVWLMLYHSTRNQWIAEPNWQIYSRGEKWFSRGSAGYVNFYERLWGFGNNTVPEKDFSDVFYQRIYLQGVLGRQLQPNLFAGLRINTSYMYGAREELGNFTGNQPGQQRSFVNGIGPTLIADGRDHPYNTMRGWYAELGATVHSSAWGSRFSYTDWAWDGRYYLPFKKGGTLALQTTANLMSGTAPWRELNRVGGPTILRGFFEGRYRGRHLLAAQAEYRKPINRFFKIAAFAAGGQVGDRLAHFNLNANWRIAGGIGARLLVNKKRQLYLRCDVAHTNDGTTGIYFRLGEAF